MMEDENILREEHHEITEHRPAPEAEPVIEAAAEPPATAAESVERIENTINSGFNRELEREEAAWRATVLTELQGVHSLAREMHSAMMTPQVSTSSQPEPEPPTVDISLPNPEESAEADLQEAETEAQSVPSKAKRIFHRLR